MSLTAIRTVSIFTDVNHDKLPARNGSCQTSNVQQINVLVQLPIYKLKTISHTRQNETGTLRIAMRCNVGQLPHGHRPVWNGLTFVWQIRPM